MLSTHPDNSTHVKERTTLSSECKGLLKVTGTQTLECAQNVRQCQRELVMSNVENVFGTYNSNQQCSPSLDSGVLFINFLVLFGRF